MFSTLEFKVVPFPNSRRFQVRTLLDGVDLVDRYCLKDGYGIEADVLFPASGPSPLVATRAGRRVRLGEPDCSGGCCGYLSPGIRFQEIRVEWTHWWLPSGAVGVPPTVWFDVEQYTSAVAAGRTRP